MANNLDEKLADYLYSWENPVETDFFGQKEKDVLDKESSKLKKTRDYLEAVENNPALGDRLQKDVVTGLIYSQGELSKVLNRAQALDRVGNRVFSDFSLVSPSGQRIIMSEYCADALGFITDGYILPNELEDLIVILKSEGILDDKISKIKNSMNQYGAVLLQRGAYEALFDLLEESSDYNLRKIQFEKRDREFENVKQTFTSEKGVSLEALKAAMTIPVPPQAVPLENNKFVQELKREVTTPELRKPTPEEMGLKSSPPLPKPVQVPHLATKLAPLPEQLVDRVRHTAINSAGLKTLMDVRTVDDLKKVQTEHLRQGELRSQIELIKSKIMAVARANKLLPFYPVTAFEESPLYKTYVAIGSAMISDSSTNRTQAYEAAAKMGGAETLTLREFEAIADLRKQIEQF